MTRSDPCPASGLLPPASSQPQAAGTGTGRAAEPWPLLQPRLTSRWLPRACGGPPARRTWTHVEKPFSSRHICFLRPAQLLSSTLRSSRSPGFQNRGSNGRHRLGSWVSPRHERMKGGPCRSAQSSGVYVPGRKRPGQSSGPVGTVGHAAAHGQAEGSQKLGIAAATPLPGVKTGAPGPPVPPGSLRSARLLTGRRGDPRKQQQCTQGPGNQCLPVG